jgi:hypothetical protein
VKVIGTVMLCPADKAAGNDWSGVPSVNAEPVSVKDDTVVGAVAVNVAVAVSDCETIDGAKSTLSPVSAGVEDAKRPKPRSVASSVPT